MRNKILGLVAVGLLTGPMAANAVPVTWYLDGWLFDDGGTASGQFVFDADTQQYSGISITTTAGTNFGGAAYGFTNQNPALPSDGIFATMVPQLLADYTNTPQLAVSWDPPGLTNAGGTVGFGGIINAEVMCGDVVCGTGGTLRFLVQGSVTTAVPEPGTLALLGLGLAGLGLSRRRLAA